MDKRKNPDWVLKQMWNHPWKFATLKKMLWFHEWLPGHMDVYLDFIRFAQELRARNPERKYSARLIVARMRWESLTQYDTPDEGTYKICSKSTPYMARLAMLIYPELRGMFSIRIHMEDGTKRMIDEDGIIHPKGE